MQRLDSLDQLRSRSYDVNVYGENAAECREASAQVLDQSMFADEGIG